MTSLVGDAMPSDAATVWRAPTFSSTGGALDRAVVIAKDRAFNVTLHDRHAPDSGRYETRIVIEALLPDGSRAHLGDHSGTFTQGARFIQGNESATPPDRLRSLSPAAAGAIGAVDERCENCNDSVVAAYDVAYRTVCTNQLPWCQWYRGEYSYGTIRACHSQSLLWVSPHVRDIVNQTILCEVSGHGITRSVIENVTPTAIDEAWATWNTPLDGPTLDQIPEGGEWDSFEFDATPAATVSQDTDSFELPAGSRISISLTTTFYDNSPPTVRDVVFRFGTNDAPSGLRLNTISHGAFVALATDAERIGAGAHTGHRSTPSDVDSYRLDAPGDHVVHITGPVEVRDANGRYAGRPIHGDRGPFVITVPVDPRGTSEWRFDVSYEPIPTSQDDAGSGTDAIDLPVEDGTYSGYLGSTDTSDSYRVFLWARQEVTVTLTSPPGASFTWSLEDTRSPGEDGHVPLVIRQVSGHGNYTLTLSRDAVGDLTNVPFAEPAIRAPAYPSIQALSNGPDGMEMLADLRVERNGVWVQERGIHRIAGNDTQLIVPDAHWSLIHAAQGRVYEQVRPDDGSATLWIDDAPTGPKVPFDRVIFPTFGPDAKLYGWAFDPNPSGYALFRYDADRTREKVLDDFPRLIVASPTGALYLTGCCGPTLRLDIDEQELTPVNFTPVAFDLGGRAFVLDQDRVIRLDLETGAREVVARSPWRFVGPAAFDGATLYAGAYDATSQPSSRVYLQKVTLDTPGFEGFRPNFEPGPMPDLTVTNVTETRHPLLTTPAGDVPNEWNETRTITVTIKNEGPGPAREGFEVDLWRDCVDPSKPLCGRTANFNSPQMVVRVTDELLPGEEKVITFSWSTQWRVGDQNLTARVDPGRTLVEAREDNNQRSLWTHARLEGLGWSI